MIKVKIRSSRGTRIELSNTTDTNFNDIMAQQTVSLLKAAVAQLKELESERN